MPETLVLVFVPGVTPAKWVGVWKERMPRVPIEVRPCSEREALESLLAGDATVALLREPFAREHLSAIPLYEERAVVVAPKDHPIATFDELSRADLVDENVLDGNPKDAVELVAANVGVAIMPQSVARLLRDEPTTSIALAWMQDATTELVEEFIGIVRGRTANSSRGAPTTPAVKPAPKKTQNRPAKPRRR